MARPANTNEARSESDPEDGTASKKPETFALSTNVRVPLHSTDHTATHRPNLEDDACRVPIFGSVPLGGNADYTSTQIAEETHVATPENQSLGLLAMLVTKFRIFRKSLTRPCSGFCLRWGKLRLNL